MAVEKYSLKADFESVSNWSILFLLLIDVWIGKILFPAVV